MQYIVEVNNERLSSVLIKDMSMLYIKDKKRCWGAFKHDHRKNYNAENILLYKIFEKHFERRYDATKSLLLE